jgi:hypothetical protein
MTYSVHEHIALKRVASIAASPDGNWLAVAVQRLDRDGAKYVMPSTPPEPYPCPSHRRSRAS